MGDADSTQYMMPEEIENWMDEALSEMDDGLESLFGLMYALNRRTHKQIASEMAYWRRLKECFTALSVFVVPVVLAIWIACAANEYMGVDDAGKGFVSSILQAVVIILMFVSGVVGLPLYVCKTLQMYYLENEKSTEITSRRSPNESERNAGQCSEDDGSSALPRDFVESLSEIRRITNRRLIDSVRQDIERRVEQVTRETEETSERSFESLGSGSETFDTGIVGEIQPTGPQLNVREDSSLTESSVVQRELGDCCGLKLTILSNRPDLTVEIEGEKNDTNYQYQQQSIVNSKPARNIQLESIGCD